MLSRSNIDEANRHLFAMHQQIQSLEGIVQQQNQQLMDRDQQLAQLEQNKNQEIQTLKNQIRELKEEAKVRDSTIQDLTENMGHLQSVLQFLPCIRGLLNEMENSAAKTPQEKVVNNHPNDHNVEGIVNHSKSLSSGNDEEDKEFYF